MNAVFRIARRAATLALGLGFAAAAHAEIYRWVDADGVTQFGARPPAAAHAERVHVYDGAADPDAAGRLDSLRDSLAEAREARAQRRAESAAAAAERKRAAEQCAAARAHRERLVTATRLFRVNASGEREKVGEAARAADLERIDEAIAEFCR
ncbi:MAG: DUF4124 domain-containing protein [Gammaproteobacteria bacterium]|uniref:DUF4124 domain-containing protein n=1 Tax=Oceanibaculum nanhaiense TaxID=1909734 RepID=UPI0032EEDCA8